MRALLLAILLTFFGCSMPSVRLSLETGEATTGESNIQRRGTTYGTKTTGGDFVQSIFNDYPIPQPTPAP